ncbi:MAG: 3-isopropylmalate dehydratase small subunit [Planctomycetota bacterium]|nr:MAG: 3-isopropylmalate dehydratase small subunit [Planctomycetota bacterium]
MSSVEIKKISGKGIPVKGNDIDTDRIIPARFLKCVTFESLGPESFKDDRFDQEGNSKNHSFDNPNYKDANILFVNKNFGCGSSREHAPQALNRWGIKTIVGESFAEIFFGNCVAMGIPCFTVEKKVIDEIMLLIEGSPSVSISVDIENLKINVDGKEFDANIPDGPQGQLLNGSWDATSQLLENEKEVKDVASSLPYVSGW